MLKKHFHFTLVLALSLSACNDGLDSPQSAASAGSIDFGAYVGNANSRGAITDAAALKSSASGFGVLAYHTGREPYGSDTKPNFMFNQQVAFDNGSWKYAPLKYWPASSDEKISFFAYAPYAGTVATLDASESGIAALPSASEAKDPVISYVFGFDIGKHIDLLYASAKDKTNKSKSIGLDFKHALSRIAFKVKGWDEDGSGTEFDNNTTVTINAVTMSTMRKGASLNLATGEWSDPVDGELQAFTLSGAYLQNNVIQPGSEAKQLNAEDAYIMLVPDNFLTDPDKKRYCILVDYTVETVDPSLVSGKLVTRNKVYRHISPGFEPGKAYNISIHLGMSGSSGSGDDTVSGTEPSPVDPNPGDPSTPSPAGQNGYVSFTTSVWDWDYQYDLDIPAEE